ncbi:MBL fold metallo-hydrolase [Streptacidiphilus sp. N1-12]|uniref:MBL fold metallo-hydrolase n=2 Tax=Streptacidiphilus alkalitolerans TaxID=3342712 RepID=A0ABV6VD35_9ACTN
MGRTRVGTTGAIGVALGAVGALAWAARDMPAAFGGDPKEGARGERLRASPQFRDGVFHNTTEPQRPGAEEGAAAEGSDDTGEADATGAKAAAVGLADPAGAEGVTLSAEVAEPGLEVSGGRQILKEMLFGKQQRRPSLPVPLVRDVEASDGNGLAVNWFGHSTALIEIEGKRILVDPVWSERCSPSQSVGPRRIHQPPVPLEELPRIDAVVISHDHYDHLDMRTVRTLARTRPELRFVVPLGVGAHLERWGIGPDRFDELDWEEEVEIDGLRLVSTSAQHFSGRGFANDGTLWSSWVIIGAEQRVFYSGDTGYFDGFVETGERYGPFDLSLIQVGAYSNHWRSVHMTPEEGVSTHLDVNQGESGHGLLVPVHWGTFVLGLHDWSEPVERLCADADARGVQVVVPRPGERIEVANPPKLDHWWRDIV